jgi:molybdate transport system substrate-binding protein
MIFRMIRQLSWGLLLVVALCVLFGNQSPRAAQSAATVAAASDLRFALESVSQAFSRHSGERVELVFGSSGNLARQAVEGAPFDLFLSADEAFVDRLAEAGLTRDRGVVYAIGRLAIFAPHGSPLTVDERLDGLRALVARGGAQRFAIANPEHAPYGRAAEAALRRQGLWERLQPALVFGENIAQAAQFATTGNAIGGILAYSLVLVPPLAEQGKYALVVESLHPPLRQRMVLLKRASAPAERFFHYLQQPSAREIFRRFGFSVPINQG